MERTYLSIKFKAIYKAIFRTNIEELTSSQSARAVVYQSLFDRISLNACLMQKLVEEPHIIIEFSVRFIRQATPHLLGKAHQVSEFSGSFLLFFFKHSLLPVNEVNFGRLFHNSLHF
jgi:hypothetical protein